MSDYISREAAIKEILDLHDCYNGFSDTYDKACIVGALEEVPTADVVEVIRCKDCSKREICRTTNIWAVVPDDNWYCADAERRENEAD